MAQNNVTMTVVDKALKDVYMDGIENCQPEDSKFYAMESKSTDFHGRAKKIPLQLANNHGISVSFSKASANRGNNEYVEFSVSRKKYYGVAYIENEVFAAGREDVGAIIDNVTRTTEGLKDEWVRSMSKHLWGDGTGALSTIRTGTTLGSTTMLLGTSATSGDAAFFSIGMVIQIANPSGPALRAATELIVTGVDTEANSISLNGVISGVAGAAIADLVLRSGDLSGVVTGIPAYIQGSGATALHGLTRSGAGTDVFKTAGFKFDCAGKAFSDAFTDGIAQHATRGGRQGKDLFMHPTDVAIFLKQLDSKVARYEAGQVSTKGLATSSFSAIKYLSTRGEINVIEDYCVTPGSAYLLEMKQWEFSSAGKSPSFLNLMTGSSVFKSRDDIDAQELRVGAYGDNLCYNPANNIKFTSLAA